MKPYLAIIKDSFREAFASYVLWAVLGLITLALVGVAPFHWHSGAVAKLALADVRNVKNLAGELGQGALAGASELSTHLWNQLGDSTKQRIEKLRDAGESDPRAMFRIRRDIVDDLNQALESDDFFQEQLWANVELPDAARELQQSAATNPNDRQLLHRWALQSALPGQFGRIPDEAVAFRYAPFETNIGPGLGRGLAEDLLSQGVLDFMSVVVGFFGILVAILVTASIVPDMLQSGSLHVLLSKPISRPILFFSKFLGGCAFVLISAAYLVSGIWLILGVRFDLWRPQLFWGIPIFLFTFAIFYSVSAIAGLVWRSSIMAIVVTLVFWFLCFSVSLLRGLCEATVVFPERITRIVPVDDELIVVRNNGRLGLWEMGAWTEIFPPAADASQMGPSILFQSELLGPIYDPTAEQLVAVDPKWPQPRVLAGPREIGWPRVDNGPGPRNVQALFRYEGRPAVVADEGIYLLDGEAIQEKQGINIFGFKIPAPPTEQTSSKISTESATGLRGKMLAAWDEERSTLYIVATNKLRRFVLNTDGLFEEDATLNLDKQDVTALDAHADTVALADADGKILRIDGTKMEPQDSFSPFPSTPVRQVRVSLDGRWVAAVFESDKLWLHDHAEGRSMSRFAGQGALCAVKFIDGQLLVADVLDRVTTLDLPSMERTERRDPSGSIVRRVYRYVLRPLHAVFPKPGELQNTMRYAVTGKDTRKADGPPGSPKATIKLDPWQPLWSNSAFIAVTLLLACIYVSRKDF